MASPEPSWEALRAHFAERRRQLGLTQVDVARAMGTSQSVVSELETGATADPCISTIARWADAVSVRIAIEAEIVVRQRFVITSRSSAIEGTADTGQEGLINVEE